jgi:hypothetical protein
VECTSVAAGGRYTLRALMTLDPANLIENDATHVDQSRLTAHALT